MSDTNESNFQVHDLQLSRERFHVAAESSLHYATFLMMNATGLANRLIEEFGADSPMTEIMAEAMTNLVVVWGMINGDIARDVESVKMEDIVKLAEQAFAYGTGLMDLVVAAPVGEASE